MHYTINPAAIGVVADIKGLTLSSQDRDFLQQPELSGLILFSRNYESPQQLAELTASIKALRPDLLLCVDKSEERRVGKECRCRWSTYHEKEKREWMKCS